MILPLTGDISVTSILTHNPNKRYVEKVKEYCADTTMHMTGLGLKDALTKIDYYESDRLLKLRQLHSPSNQDFYGRLHRPVDKIWTAKGGSVNYLLPDAQKKTFQSIMSDVINGYSIRAWLETFWLPAYWYDPMGIILMEVGNNSSYPTYKSVQDVFDMPHPKGRHFDYLVFKVEKGKPENVFQDVNKTLASPAGYYRIIDDEYDRMVKWDGSTITVIEEETYINYYGKVPAATASDIWDNVKQFYVSPDDDTIPIAWQHLRNRSVMVMFELHHGFPLNWQYESKCSKCRGTGKLSANDCDSCNGTGKESKKDVSKLILLPFPKSKDDPIITTPGGTVEAAIDSWQEMKLTIEQNYKEAHYCTWGTHQVEDSSQETATGRFIDVQPVNDRLGKYSNAAEWMETWITDMMGSFYFPNTYGGCEINLGRRYLVEPADVIAEKLQKAVAGKMSYSYMKTLYFQWVDSEYSGDEMTRLRLTMEFKLDPAPFMSIPDAKNAYINPNDYQKKLYYGQWLETLPMNWFYTTTFTTLQNQFDTYIADLISKQPEIEPEKPPNNG